MNTSITSDNETVTSLLSLTNTYDSIDISDVSKVIGSSAEIATIKDSSNFVGFSTTKTLIVD